jgi:hypothetical protein
MRLKSYLLGDLPRLAWLAVVDPARGRLETFHGRDVEVSADHLVEGVWDGPFSEAGFVASANFFGSGLRVEGDSVVVVPPRALLDRLVVVAVGGKFVVSNSFTLLLHALEARLLPDHGYVRETFTILDGVRGYEPRVPLLHDGADHAEQRFFFPFRISARGIEVLEDRAEPTFDAFADYRGALSSALDGIVANATDPARRSPFRFRVTLSRGYDSPAAAALVAPFSMPVAYTAARSNSLLRGPATNDDGSEIASRLGLQVEPLGRSMGSFDERLFLAGSTTDPELIFGSLAEDAQRDAQPTVLVSGYHGDKVWALDPGSRYLGDDLKRGDTSGLSLTEARLSAGWVNLPVPFIGARGISSIVGISQSAEMAPWRLGTSYDRPIPRRIAEEAGIPREAFGEHKRAVVKTIIQPQDSALRADFGGWLMQEEGRRLGMHRAAAYASWVRWFVLRAGEKIVGRVGFNVPEADPWAWLPGGDPTSLLFRWAVTRLSGDDGPYPAELRERVREALEKV